MNIVFMGTGKFAQVAFEHLLTMHKHATTPICITALYTKLPRFANRKIQEPDSLHKQALLHDMPVLTPSSLKDFSIEQLHSYKPDMLIVVSYGLILSTQILDIPPLGVLNIHASLLPKWRGAAPVERAILAGDDEAGVCIMKMTKGLDEGPIISRTPYTLSKHANAKNVKNDLAIIGANQLVNILYATLKDKSFICKTSFKQETNGVTYAKKIDKKETRVSFLWNAQKIDRYIRALGPEYGVYVPIYINENKASARLIIINATPVMQIEKDLCFKNAIGSIIAIDKQSFLIACGEETALNLKLVQLPGKQACSANQLAQGYKALRIGFMLEERLEC